MKRKLILEDLALESFDTESDTLAAPRGTVRGNDGTGGNISCGFTCITCYQTCGDTCDFTCVQTCPFSCPAACATRT
jgi:hypothetical protein